MLETTSKSLEAEAASCAAFATAGELELKFTY